MPQITITRPQREAVYQQLIGCLTAVGDIYLALDNGDFEAARRFRRECEDAMRLLDDLGWEPDVPGEQFEITVPAEQLGRAMRHLHEQAAGSLGDHVRRPRDEDDVAESDLIACQAYASVLARLAEPGDSSQ